MHDIVWEEKWHTEGWPEVGDYIQIKHHDEYVESDVRTSEGLVYKIDPVMDWLFLYPEVPNDNGRVAIAWRRGALPEYNSVKREETVGA